jgi:hypothetical protein
MYQFEKKPTYNPGATYLNKIQILLGLDFFFLLFLGVFAA